MHKTANGQRNDYIAGYLPDYFYFKKFYKIIAIDLGKKLFRKQRNKLILLEI